jgi:minor extracellular serine protease Vpr
VNNAQRAGAVGVILYQIEGSDFLFPPVALENTGIPAALIGNTDGKALKSFLESNPNRNVTIDPSLEEVTGVEDEVAYFSSVGPSIGNSAIKPEVVAVGTDVYTATQSFDPSGEMYDPMGYTTVQGTSFAVPFVAGAAAIVKQQNTQLTPADIKSKIVNTANEVLWDFDFSGNRVPARVPAIGAGKLNAADAVRSNVTIDPPVVSLGAISTGQLPSVVLTVKNVGSSTVNLQFERIGDRRESLTITPSSLTVTPGVTQQVTVRLEGVRPDPGQYSGMITVSGGAVPLRIPYLYVRGDGVPFNMVPLRGFDFRGTVNLGLPLTFKVIDRFGVPVPNVPVIFRPVLGGGSIERGNESTDAYGIAEARVILGPELGEQEFEAEVRNTNLKLPFIGVARLLPVIESNGVVNAASGQVGRGVAPGSYISIFGRGLSPARSSAKTPWLPYSLAGVSVSFDVPGRFSLPGRFHFVSDSQINVQVPWELQGQTTALMKVSIGNFSSALYTVPLNDFSPGLFEYTEASSGRSLAAALDQNFGLLGTGNPARRSQTIQLFVNGLGPVDRQQVSGEPTPTDTLVRTTARPEVTIGGRPAEVTFSGLAPGFVSLYQVNVVVPGDAPGGVQPVVIRTNGIDSKAVNIVVE